MDAYIPQSQWKKLIVDSIGNELAKYGFEYVEQTDRSYHYSNDKIEMIISYFHKEIGIDFRAKNKTINSSDIINKCAEISVPKDDDSFESIEDYFKYLLRNQFLNIENCLPSVFYGNF